MPVVQPQVLPPRSPQSAWPLRAEAALPPAGLPQPGHPLVEELRSGSLGSLMPIYAGLFNAGDALARLEGVETRLGFELLRVLQLERPRMTRGFEYEMARGFNPLSGAHAALDLHRYAAQPTDELEENLLIAGMVSRAKTRFRDVLHDLEHRLQKLVSGMSLPLSPRALSPARLCEAYRAVLDALDVPSVRRIALLKLFEVCVLEKLAPVYAETLKILARHRIDAAPKSPPLPVDAATLKLLNTLAAPGSSQRSADAELASELLARLKRGPAEAAVAQRLALCGRLMTEWLADPQLPENYRPLVEHLRLAVIKAALPDSVFFTSAAHPLRRLLNETAQMLLLARIGDQARRIRTGDRLAALPEDFALEAGFVRRALDGLELLEDADVARFVESLGTEAAERRTSLLAAVRRAVALEMDMLTLGRRLHPGAREFLFSGLAPLLANHLLHAGSDGPQWREALQRTQYLLQSLEPRHSVTGALPQRLRLLEQLAADLRDSPLPAERRLALLHGLNEAYAARDQALNAQPPAKTVPAAVAAPKANAGDVPPALAVVLGTERWFRVFEPRSGQVHWLQLRGIQAGHAQFSNWDGSKTLAIGLSRLAEDLRSGRSEPIHPTPEMLEALQRLRAH